MARKRNEELQLWQMVAPVEFSPRLKERNENQALLVLARQGAGYEIAGGQLGHAIKARATHVLLDFSAQACSMRYQIDGAWEQLPPMDRESGDAMLYAIKQLCLMDPADRRSAQSGECGIKVGKNKYQLEVKSQGVKTGERVIAQMIPEKLPFESLAELGMRDKMIEAYKSNINSDGKLIVITAPKTQGLTTTWNVTLNAADRFIRDFQSVEPQEAQEPEVINVNTNYFGGDTGLEETQLVNKLLLKEPDVLLFPNLPEPESLRVTLEQSKQLQKQVMMRMVADNPFAAMAGLLERYPDAASLISKQVGLVICQRLIRRLCDNCKVGFEPPPALLQQLGIPQGRVAMLYQPFILPPPEQQVDENGRPAPITPCHLCEGRGYLGRVAIFEMLTPGDELRKAFGTTRDINQWMAIAKSEGHRNIKAEAVLTVARGLTSLDELKRAFQKR